MKFLVLSLLFFALPSVAFVSGDKLTITAVVLWEDSEINPLYFKASNEMWCYIPAGQKTLQSMIFTLYASGRPAEIHCADLAETIMGFEPAHRLHRIIAK